MVANLGDYKANSYRFVLLFSTISHICRGEYRYKQT